MVGADPDGMMDDIFEHAIAYDAKRQQVIKQIEAPEHKEGKKNEVEESIDDGLDRETCSFRWNGELYRDLSDEVMKAIGLIESNYKNGKRPTTKESLLKNSSQQSIGKLFRRGDAARFKEILIDSGKSVELPENGLKMARHKA